MLAGVAEVVLFPPPVPHPPGDGRGGHVVPAAGGEDVHLLALVAAGDLPQLQDAPLVLPGGDRDGHVGVSQVVNAGAAVAAVNVTAVNFPSGMAGISLPPWALR